MADLTQTHTPAPYQPVAGSQRIISGFCLFVAVCAATFLLGDLFFYLHLRGGGYPFTFPGGWYWVMTAAGDLCLVFGSGGLFMLIQYFRRSRRNVGALHQQGALSDPEVHSTILLHPGHFALSYERVLLDLWQIFAPPHITRSSQGRVGVGLPYLWWVLLILTPLLVGIMGGMEARYYGMGTRTGQLFLSTIYPLVYGTMIVTCWLTWYLTSNITAGQERLAALPRSSIPPAHAQQTPAPRGYLFRWYHVPALLIILGTGLLTDLFLDRIAPKIFIDNPEMAIREDLRNRAFTAFTEQQYAQLEAAHGELEADIRTSSGIPALNQFYLGLDRALSHDAARTPAQLAEWQKLFPDSAVVPVAGALYRMTRAANSTPGEALKALESGGKTAQKNPHYWLVRLEIMAQAGRPRDDLRKVLTQGIARFPDYYPLYFKALTLYQPLGTSPPDLIDKMMELSRTAQPDILYARLNWYMWEMADYKSEALKQASWSRMVAGFDEMLRLYPVVHNLNAFAYFACQAGDLARTQKLMRQIEGQAVHTIWPLRQEYGRCNIWALSQPEAKPE